MLQAETVEERPITQMPDIHQFKNQVEQTVLTFTGNDWLQNAWTNIVQIYQYFINHKIIIH